METLVLKLKGAASSICSKQDKELLIPVTYDSSIDGNEYGIVALNLTARNSKSGQYSYDDVLKITDKKGNYQFGMDTYDKNSNTVVSFDPVNGTYQDILTFEGMFTYGTFTTRTRIYFKKKKDASNVDGLVDVLPVIDNFTFNMLGQDGIGIFVSEDSKAKARTPLTLSALPVQTDSIKNISVGTLNCSLGEIPDILPNAVFVHVNTLSSHNIDELVDSKIEDLQSDRFDGDLINLPAGLKKISDTYEDKGYLHYSGGKSAKFTQLNSVLLYQSALSLTQTEMDNFLGCLAVSTWSGDNKRLCIKPGKGVSLNQESIEAIKGKGVAIV